MCRGKSFFERKEENHNFVKETSFEMDRINKIVEKNGNEEGASRFMFVYVCKFCKTAKYMFTKQCIIDVCKTVHKCLQNPLEQGLSTIGWLFTSK